MFTGLIESIGKFARRGGSYAGMKFYIECKFDSGEYVKGAGSSTLKVISDFIPFVTDQVRTVWEFVPEGQYRLIDMVSHEKIDTIDIQVFWVDQNDNFFRIEIPFNQEITIKLAFLNKKLYKNYITREKVDFKREFNR